MQRDKETDSELFVDVPHAGPLRLVPPPINVLRALLRDALEEASALVGVSLTPYVVEHRWFGGQHVPMSDCTGSEPSRSGRPRDW